MKVVNATRVLQVKPPVHSRLVEREREREDNDKKDSVVKLLKLYCQIFTQKKTIKILTVRYLYPITDIKPDMKPINSPAHGPMNISATEPIATPPARVAFWT